MSEDKKATEVVERIGKARRALEADRRNDQLNRLFLMGYQWAQLVDNEVRMADRLDVVGERRRSRVTDNQMLPRFMSLLGRMTAKKLAFENRPTSADNTVRRGGKIAEMVVSDIHDEQRWEQVRIEELFGLFTGGTSAVAIEWDSNAGGVAIDPRTDKVENTGKKSPLRLAPLSISQFTLEPGTRRPDEARWAIVETLAPPEQVRDHYGLSKTPDADRHSATSSGVSFMTTSTQTDANTPLTQVLTLYERPNDLNPNGEVRVVIGGKTEVSEEWPFPWEDRLNVVTFRCIPFPGRWNGWTPLNSARPIQVHYNMLRSTLLEHARLVSNPRLLLPKGSVDNETEFTDEPGEIIPFDGEFGEPKYLNPPSIARWLHDESDRLLQAMDDILSAHSVTRGITPGERASARALALVAEKDDTPLSVVAQDQSEGWAQVASYAVQLLEHHNQQGEAKIEQEHGPPINVRWRSSDLRGQDRFFVPLESTLPVSRAALHAQLIEFKGAFPEQFAQMDQEKLLGFLDLPGGHSVVDMFRDDHVRLSQHENAEMMAGNYVDVEPFHDHAKHLRQHNRLRNTLDYTYAPDEWRELVDLHIKAHEALAMEELAQVKGADEAVPGISAELPTGNELLGMAGPDPLMTDPMAGGPPQAGPMPGGM